MAYNYQAIVQNEGIRVFAAAVGYLSKIGRDISVEITAETTTLRALNETASQFASVTFERAFFMDYQYTQPEGDVSIRCLLSAKSTLHAFRALKGVERITLYFAEQEGTHLFVMLFHGAHSVTRSATLSFADAEALQAEFDRDAARHRFIARSDMLTHFLDNIHGSDEVTFLAQGYLEAQEEEEGVDHAASAFVVPSRVVFQSYVPRGVDERTVRSNLVTAISMSANEFVQFHLSWIPPTGTELVDEASAEMTTDVTFSLKAFRALLALASDRCITGDEVAMYWNGSGGPLLLTTDGGASRTFRADLVLATLDTPVAAAAGVAAAAAPPAALKSFATAARLASARPAQQQALPEEEHRALDRSEMGELAPPQDSIVQQLFSDAGQAAAASHGRVAATLAAHSAAGAPQQALQRVRPGGGNVVPQLPVEHGSQPSDAAVQQLFHSLDGNSLLPPASVDDGAAEEGSSRLPRHPYAAAAEVAGHGGHLDYGDDGDAEYNAAKRELQMRKASMSASSHPERNRFLAPGGVVAPGAALRSVPSHPKPTGGDRGGGSHAQPVASAGRTGHGDAADADDEDEAMARPESQEL